jgi:hypothetical protein
VTVCSPAVIAAAAADDCVECQRAVSTGCTEDCVIGGPQSSVDCPECAEEHHEENITTTEKKSNNIHRKVGKVLSAADAFDAEEPIQACDVPGCGAIEWDEKAVDELVGMHLMIWRSFTLTDLLYALFPSFAAAVQAPSIIINHSRYHRRIPAATQ